MKKRKQEAEAEGNSERWLVSYSDFITLLMVLFVVLYSMGQVDVEKYKQLAENLRITFSGGSAVKVIDTQIDSGGGNSEKGSPNPIVIPGIPDKPTESSEVAGELTNMLTQMNLGNGVSVQTNIEGVLISLSEKLVFTPGTAELLENTTAYLILDMIVDMLRTVDNKIRVIGNTDNTPPIDPKYEDNWELSMARARVVGEYLIDKGIDPSRITMSGNGEYKPVFPNDTDEHRRLNSRCDIVVVYKSSSNEIIDTNSLIQGLGGYINP